MQIEDVLDTAVITVSTLEEFLVWNKLSISKANIVHTPETIFEISCTCNPSYVVQELNPLDENGNEIKHFAKVSIAAIALMRYRIVLVKYRWNMKDYMKLTED